MNLMSELFSVKDKSIVITGGGGVLGSAMAAVLGTMRVTEQIDALATMGADPIHYLVVPRFLACILLIPALTIMADFMGIVGGYFYSVINMVDKIFHCSARNSLFHQFKLGIISINLCFIGFFLLRSHSIPEGASTQPEFINNVFNQFFLLGGFDEVGNSVNLYYTAVFRQTF